MLLLDVDEGSPNNETQPWGMFEACRLDPLSSQAGRRVLSQVRCGAAPIEMSVCGPLQFEGLSKILRDFPPLAPANGTLVWYQIVAVQSVEGSDPMPESLEELLDIAGSLELWLCPFTKDGPITKP